MSLQKEDGTIKIRRNNPLFSTTILSNDRACCYIQGDSQNELLRLTADIFKTLEPICTVVGTLQHRFTWSMCAN